MKPEPPSVAIGTLLAHRAWVRRLAASLARDEASADDLEQETWLTSLRAPPRQPGSARPWLARVVRGLAFKAFRARGRRLGHERAGARAEPVRAAGDLVAEAEVHKRLVVAVLDLDEPYRATVLMRFFEGLPPRRIALAMQSPVETVRTRLRRALEALRARLSTEGGAATWLAALGPLVGRPFDVGVGLGAGSAGTSGAAAAVAGGTLMTGKATLVAASALALAAGFVGARISGSGATAGSGDDAVALAARLDALERARPASGGAAALPSGAPTLASGGAPAAEVERPSLEGRLEVLERDLAAARKTNAELVAWASGVGPAPRDAAAELQRLEGLSDEELLETIRKLSRASHATAEEKRLGADRVVRACAAFLARAPGSPARAEVLITEGSSWLQLGDAARSEESLTEALSLAGRTSREGHTATIQLAFAASHRKDNRRAADLMFGLAREAETSPGEHAYLRFAASTYLATIDEAQARAELRAMIEEYGGSEDSSTRHWVSSARRHLEKLEAAERAR